MTAVCLKYKFRGQECKVQGDRVGIIIRNALPQQGGRPTIGLSDSLLEYAGKFHKTIYVSVETPKVNFHTTASEWIKGAHKEEQKSYYGIPWFIYRKEIPKVAFADYGVSDEERKRREWYQSLAG